MKVFRKIASIASAALVALAIALPVAASAANPISLSNQTTVANATQSAGSNNWTSTVNASYNEVVAVQVIYNNTEEAGSGKVANDVHVKVNLPTTAGATQNITTSVSGSNTNTVSGSSTVNLSRSDAYLQFIPGTVTWRHATADNADVNGSVNVTTENLAASKITVSGGTIDMSLGNELPCQAGSIVLQARVIVPGVSVDKFVRLKGDTTWQTSINAKLGDTLEYEIAYKNTGNSLENNVEFRDQLPKGITYLAGSTKLKSGNYPNGLNVTSDDLVTKGIFAGDYAPGAAGYVMFTATVSGEGLACGDNLLRNVAYVQPQGMNYYYNTADVHVNKACSSTPPSTTPPTSLPNTGAGDTIAIAGATVAAGYGVSMLKRKFSRL